MQTSAELEIVREMKEKCCCVALDYDSELRNGGTASSEVQYTLPDGRLVSLHTERFRYALQLKVFSHVTCVVVHMDWFVLSGPEK